MTRSKQKEMERRQLDLILNNHVDWISDVKKIVVGDPSSGQPDFLIFRGKDQVELGVEHTCLKQNARINGYEPAEIEATRLKVCEMSRAIYLRSNQTPVHVNATIGTGPYAEPQKIAEYLASQVAANIDAGQCVSLWPSMGSPVELHFSVWDAEDDEPSWRLSSVGETQLLTIETMQEAVSNKNSKAVFYRKHCEEIWLLVVSTMFPSSSNSVLPQDAGTWNIRHSFDKVYLYCQEDNQLLMF